MDIRPGPDSSLNFEPPTALQDLGVACAQSLPLVEENPNGICRAVSCVRPSNRALHG
jgi:hypothetical protein